MTTGSRYLEPGNTLPFLYTPKDRGIIEFNEARDYHLTYILRDYKGNVTTYNFTVKGEKAKIPEPEQEEGALFRWNHKKRGHSSVGTRQTVIQCRVCI